MLSFIERIRIILPLTLLLFSQILYAKDSTIKDSWAAKVISLYPAPHATSVPDTAIIRIKFSKEIIKNSINDSSIVIYGSIGGIYKWQLKNSNNNILEIIPVRPFNYGEKITINVCNTIFTVDNDTIRPFLWECFVSPETGTGRFKEGSLIRNVGFAPEPVVADMNNDKLPDLIYSGWSGFVILQNIPGGTFNKTEFSIGYEPSYITTGDINNDGYNDIVAIKGWDPNPVRIFKQSSNGTFTEEVVHHNFAPGSFEPGAVKCADINNDGLSDLVVYQFSDEGGIVIFKNLGKMKFEFGGSLGTSVENMLEISDMDNDGDLDFVVPAPDYGQTFFYENQHNFNFAERTIQNISGTNLKIIDFNNDRLPDVVLLDSRGLHFLKNDNNFNFTRVSQFTFSQAGSFTTADFDNDDAPDIVVTTQNSIFYLSNKGNFSFSSESYKPTYPGVFNVTSSDVDEDGDLDLVLSAGDLSVLFYLNGETVPVIAVETASYKFGVVKPFSSKSSKIKIYNKGGREQLLISGITNTLSAFKVFPDTATIAPSDSFEVNIEFTPDRAGIFTDTLKIVSNDLSTAVVNVVLSGEGDFIYSVYPDYFSVAASDTSVISAKFCVPLDESTLTDSSIYITGSVSGRIINSEFIFNTADSTLLIKPAVPFSKSETVSVVLTDKIKTAANISIRPVTWSFTVESVSSSAIFRSRKQFSLPYGAVITDIKDFDNDKDLDIACLLRWSGEITFFQNNGLWDFRPIKTMTLGSNSDYMMTGDYDKDGDIDLALPGFSSIDFYRNDGSFIFTKVSIGNYHGYYPPFSQGDYDSDGDPDFVTHSSLLLKNEGNFNFVITDTLKQSEAGLMNSADLDIDGDIDIQSGRNIFINSSNFSFTEGKNLTSDINGLCNPDNDNDIDLLAVGNILINEGNLVFKDVNALNIEYNYNEAEIADYDGDKKEDIILFHNNWDNCFYNYFKNKGDLKFDQVFSKPISGSIADVASGDLDNDGDIDFVVLSTAPHYIELFENMDHQSSISLSSDSYNFGSVKQDSSREASFYIRNQGDMLLQVDSIFTPNIIFSVSPVSGMVSPNDSLKITVSFRPEEVRFYTDTVFIHSGDPEKQLLYYFVSGKTDQQIVIGSIPPAHSANAHADTILIMFSQAIIPETLNDENIFINGSRSGAVKCRLIYDSGLNKMTVIPEVKFLPGEDISIIITSGIKLQSNIPVLSPYEINFTSAASEGTGLFSRVTDIPTGKSPSYLASADFNKDGLTDLVVSNSGSDTLSIIMSVPGTGPGSQKKMSLGSLIRQVICGDFNRDGRIDIAVNTNSSVIFLENKGADSFTMHREDFFDNSCITCGDYNGDGNLDVAYYNSYTDSLGILLNKTSFRFENIPVYNASLLRSLISADIDNDGDLDIIGSTYTENVIKLFNNQQGLNFSYYEFPYISDNIRVIEAADFDSDGRVDVASNNPGGSSLSVMHNDNYQLFHNISQPEITFSPGELTAGDYDSDGDIDLAAINNGNYSFSVLTNNESNFKLAGQVNFNSYKAGMVNGDFNGDGSLDVAIASRNDSYVTWLLNAPAKSFILSTYIHNFGEIKLGDSANVKITFYNNGTDSIKIDSICFAENYFIAKQQNFVIPPQDSALVEIVFIPDSVSNFTDTLTVYSNTTSYNKIVISGNAIPFTEVRDKGNILFVYSLNQNYPNPFNPSTTISFTLAAESKVTLKIYDILGQEVKTLIDETLGAGGHNIKFNASSLNSGVYFYSIEAAGADGKEYKSSRKMILMK